MKIGKWAWGCLAALPLLAGCAGFWDPPPATTTTTATTLSSGYFYVLDVATSHVLSYNIASGVLTFIGTTVVPAEPIALTVAPNNSFLYVSTLRGIYLYTLSGGALTLANASQTIVGDPAAAMAVDSTNSWLLETSGLGVLNAIPVVSTTGLPSTTAAICTNNSTICSVNLTGTTINQMAFAPNDTLLFVAAGNSGTAAYTFAAGNTNPFDKVTTIAPANTSGGSALSVAVDPSNRLAYIGEAGAVNSNGGLRAFTISATGALSEISGSPFASGGSGPHAILPKGTGDVVYVANWNGTGAGNITGFSIAASGTTYSLSKLSSVAVTGIQPNAMVEDSEQNFVLVENEGGSPYLSAYFFDKTTPTQLDLTIQDSSYVGTTLAAAH
jgi:6-phosphogluconolactonase (cycloisomerase 2 family)